MITIISFSSNIITHILEAVSLKVNDLSTYTPVEFFKTKILLSLILSLIFCSPLWLLSIYSFSRTGLTEYEKNNVRYSFIIGQTFFLLGCAAGFSLVTPYFLDLLLADSEMVIQNLSVYETIKIIISTTLFTGLLISTPVFTLLINRMVKGREDVRKYIYTLIFFVAVVATPKPSMILNMIFLISFILIAEITMLLAGVKNEN